MRLFAVVEYDGTDFAGFQLQAHRDVPPRTVQAELEHALAACLGESIRVTGSGRTDTGVHARGQVVHFDSSARLATDCNQLLRAVNARLPEDVKVRTVRQVPETWHARYSALSRRYCYRIYADRTPSPLLRRHTCHIRSRMDVPRMDSAARHFAGIHDFKAFAAQEAAGSTVREVFRARVSERPASTWAAPQTSDLPIWHTSAQCDAQRSAQIDDAGGDDSLVSAPQLVEIEVEASGFLRHMMRRIAGTLIKVGDGRLAPDDVASIVASKDKSLAGPTAPARGLCLEEVRYQQL